jgi:hypothetical protein
MSSGRNCGHRALSGAPTAVNNIEAIVVPKWVFPIKKSYLKLMKLLIILWSMRELTCSVTNSGDRRPGSKKFGEASPQPEKPMTRKILPA